MPPNFEREDFPPRKDLYSFAAGGAVPGFPAGAWTPTRNVPTDPTPADCPDAGTRRWMELADLSYGLLIGLVEHYLVADPTDRELLTGWIFAEMRTRSTRQGPSRRAGCSTSSASRRRSRRSRTSRPRAAPPPTLRRRTWMRNWRPTGPV
jgi:hypothetical protein